VSDLGDNSKVQSSALKVAWNSVHIDVLLDRFLETLIKNTDMVQKAIWKCENAEYKWRLY